MSSVGLPTKVIIPIQETRVLEDNEVSDEQMQEAVHAVFLGLSASHVEQNKVDTTPGDSRKRRGQPFDALQSDRVVFVLGKSVTNGTSVRGGFLNQEGQYTLLHSACRHCFVSAGAATSLLLLFLRNLPANERNCASGPPVVSSGRPAIFRARLAIWTR